MTGNEFVVTVVGPTRNREYFKFAKAMDKILFRLPKDITVLVSGSGGGTDYLVFIYALRRGLRHIQFEQDKYDGAAGIYRMQEKMMVETTNLIAVVDNRTRSIEQAINLANEKMIPVRRITASKEQDHVYQKQEKSYGRLRKLSIRTLSRYRERRAYSPNVRRIQR